MTTMQSTNQMRRRTRILMLLHLIIQREICRPPNVRNSASPPRCPRCHNSIVAKRGHDSMGRQRYRCNACMRSFTVATGSSLSSTNVSVETWLLFAECFIDKKPLREAAAYCNVSLKTAFYMRKRLNRSITRYSGQAKRTLARMDDQRPDQ